MYALSAPVKLTVAAERVSPAELLEAMGGITLGTAELKTTCARSGAAAGEVEQRPPTPK